MDKSLTLVFNAFSLLFFTNLELFLSKIFFHSGNFLYTFSEFIGELFLNIHFFLKYTEHQKSQLYIKRLQVF